MKSWKIIKGLGQGGAGGVWLATTPEGQEVAVKVLSPSPGSSLSSFQEEVQILVRLKHPSLVPILGYQKESRAIFGEEKGPCYWMERVEGRPILEAAKGASAQQMLEWLVEALEALSYLESQRVVHGDLSPNNILIDRRGKIRVLDFGSAVFGDKAAIASMATLPYMAPERIDGLSLPASDLFSLGTIFYEIIAGRHPRYSSANTKSLQDVMKEASPLVFENAIAARVIDRMIASDLGQRFASAASALSALRSEAPVKEDAQAPYHSALMLGAEAEFEKFQKALTSMKAAPKVIFFHGITGVGKSRFLREASFQGALQGFEMSEIKIDSCLERPLSEGVTLLKSLEKYPLDELARLLTLRRIGLSKGALLILEWNDDGLSPEKRVFFDDLVQWPGGEEIHLRNLNQKRTEELLRGALGNKFNEADVGKIFRLTGGNPRLVLEVVGVLRADPQADLSSLGSAQEILESRWEVLSASQKKILTALSLTSLPADLASLRESVEAKSASELFADLKDLIHRDLVAYVPDADGYAPATELLRDAVLDGVSNKEKTPWHRRWLAALKTRPYPDPQRLYHALALGDVEEAAAGLSPTVESLVAHGRNEDALGLVQQAKSFRFEADLRSRLLRAEINLLNDLGQYEKALVACEEWISLNASDEPTPLRTVKYWLVTAMNHQSLGHHDEAQKRLERCLTEGSKLGVAEGRSFLIRAHSLLGVEAERRGDYENARIHFSQGLALSEKKDRRRAEILRNQAVAESASGRWKEARDLLEESRKIYREESFPDGEFAAHLQEGILALDHDASDVAEKAYRQAEAVAERCGNPLLLASVWHNRSVMARKRGMLAEAVNLLSQSRRIFQALSSRSDLAESLSQSAIVEASVGRFANAESFLKQLKTMSEGMKGLEDLVSETDGLIRELRDGQMAPIKEKAPGPDLWTSHWNRELALRLLVQEGKRPDQIELLLEEFYLRLPDDLKISFVDRSDYKKYGEKAGTVQSGSSAAKTVAWSPRFLQRLRELTDTLLTEDNMTRVLQKLMDTALELADTENGFLLLQDKNTKDGPIPGFLVAAARNIKKEDLQGLDYAISLSAVRDALKSGKPVVTDNALQDPRYREARSVVLSGLKSIIALPVKGPKGVIQGVFYLDHRLRVGRFDEEVLSWLEVFADIASLTLQKGRMIEDLKKSNRKLSHQIEEQATDASKMRRELEEARRLLKYRYSDIIGKSRPMLEVLSLVDRITDSKVPVWIFGESGTGKEAIARSLHFNGPRAGKPFVTENCSALPESLLESELFGHKKGAFTHATADKKGILQYADGGTIFLDEIADMSLNLQAKLLRFLQEGEIRPIGSNSVVKVDVRVVSASNKDLARLVAEGKFREDLFYRLNGVTVALPPLRERLEDLPLLADHFLKMIAEREKKPQVSISPQAMDLFLKYSWPGNVRELQNTLETAALFAEKGEIHPRSLKFKTALTGDAAAKPVAEPLKPADQAEPKLIEVLTAIRDNCFHKGDAAKALGISRRNLYTRLARYGIASDLKTIKLAIEKYLTPR